MMEVQANRNEQVVYQHNARNRSSIDSMLPLPTPLNIEIASIRVAVKGQAGGCQEENRINQDRINKGKDKIGEQGSFFNVDREPPDKIKFNDSQQLSNKQKNKNQSSTGKYPISHQRDDNFDEYGELDSEDEYDVDTQSLGEGIEPGEEMNIAYQHQKGPMLQSSNVEEIREVTGKQGLSPRGRKLLKQNKNASTSKPNTRARSRGL